MTVYYLDHHAVTIHYSSAGSVKIITTTRPGDNSKYNLCIWSLMCLDCSTLQSIYKTTVQGMSYNYWQLHSSVLICPFGWTSLPPSFRTDVIMAAAAAAVQTDRGVPLSTVSSSINLWLFLCISDCGYMRRWQVERQVHLPVLTGAVHGRVDSSCRLGGCVLPVHLVYFHVTVSDW